MSVYLFDVFPISHCRKKLPSRNQVPVGSPLPMRSGSRIAERSASQAEFSTRRLTLNIRSPSVFHSYIRPP
jgi:hypothetical protein